MGVLIDLFTKKPIGDGDGRVSADNDDRAWFKKAAKEGPENLDDSDQAEWIILFHEFYLARFLDAAEGIREATNVEDLESFMQQALDEMRKWPKK